MPTIYSDDPTIDILFPEEKLNLYFKRLNLNSENELDDVKIELIFAMSFKDFKIGKLSLDDFSSIGGFLFNELSSGTMRSSRFGSVLSDTSELNYYIRSNISETSIKELGYLLISIEKYFKEDRPELLDQI